MSLIASIISAGLDVLESDAMLGARFRRVVGTAAPVALPELASVEGGLLSKQGLARELKVSVSTIDRFDATGMPHEVIGTRKRYDLAAVRRWLSERGRKPTTPKPSKNEDSVDVDSVLAGSRLRMIGGGR